MPFARTLDELKRNGFIFKETGRCRSCKAEIEWWQTPKGKNIPLDPMPEANSPSIAHFSTCPSADKHRKQAA